MLVNHWRVDTTQVYLRALDSGQIELLRVHGGVDRPVIADPAFGNLHAIGIGRF